MPANPGAAHQPRWVVVLQLVTIGAGLALGVTARPDAAVAVLLIALLQLLATGIGWRGIGGPVAYAAAVALVVGAAAADPALRELLYLGGILYVHLGLALATHGLVARARTVSGLVLGAIVLLVAVLVLAGVATAYGAPASMALLASGVPVLAGALVATSLQLRRARRDRLDRGRWPVAPAPAADADQAATSLLTVAMLSGNLATDAPDRRTAAWADELHRIAVRGLGAEPTGETGRVRIELRIADETGPREEMPPTDAAAPGTAGEPDVVTPELSDREREIARLLTTGASNATIARELYLSEATIKGHVSRMMRRHECDNRTQLALLATSWSL